MKHLRSGDKVYSVDNQGRIIEDEIIMILHAGPKAEGEPFFLHYDRIEKTKNLLIQLYSTPSEPPPTKVLV